MLRILTVITTIEPEVGGPSYVAVNAVLAEREAGLKTVLISTVPAGSAPISDLDRRLELAGAPHHRFARPRFARDAFKRWGVSLGLARYLLRNAREFDVIHAHYVWSFGTVFALLAGRIRGVPVVLTPHESLTTFGYDTSRSSLRRKQKLWMSRLVLANVGGVFLSSELERRDSPVPTGIATVIPHPVPDEGQVAAERSVDAAPVVIGYLGRFHEKKRVGLLISALAELAPDVRLVVGGDEPPNMLAELRQIAGRSGVAARVDFVGFIPESQRLAFLEGIDVLAMPSTYECFGMVAAEAMTAGVPVVVTSRSGIAPFVEEGHAGLVFDVEQPAELTAKLASLVDDPALRAQLGRNASRVARDSFSYRAYAEQTLRQYRRIS